MSEKKWIVESWDYGRYGELGEEWIVGKQGTVREGMGYGRGVEWWEKEQIMEEARGCGERKWTV